MQVELFKKVATYKDQQGQDKQATRFYVRCGGALIPVEVTYFGKGDEKDTQYGGRKAILTAFADDLPEKEKSTDDSKSGNKGNAPQVEG